ncbi:hypothetical protein OFC03_30670, partial [Escherichia coli]|nr:hypothetical protein [Escherichia coli]
PGPMGHQPQKLPHTADNPAAAAQKDSQPDAAPNRGTAQIPSQTAFRPMADRHPPPTAAQIVKNVRRQ